MANGLMRTPVCEVQWCTLVGPPRQNRIDPTKAPTWEVEAVLHRNNEIEMDFTRHVFELYKQHHGDKNKHLHWCPVKDDKKDKEIVLVRFKIKQFKFRDGNLSEGPKVYDNEGHMWPNNVLIGNGSKMRIGFDVYAWTAPSGSGITLQPKGAQVIEYLAAPEAPGSFESFGFTTQANSLTNDQQQDSNFGSSSNDDIPF